MERSAPTATPGVGRAPARTEAVAERLGSARTRTLSLLEGLPEAALNRVHSPLMSPLVWDLGHIATFEDLWLVQNAHGAEPLRGDLSSVYDPFTAERSQRGALPYLRTGECFAYMETVRARTLEHLESADLSPESSDLLANGFVYEMVLRHEMQHTETMLQTLQLMTSDEYGTPGKRATPSRPDRQRAGMVRVPGGRFQMGASEDRYAYDNERPRHERDVREFLIDAMPVSNRRFADFALDGGYDRPELWSEEGWLWRSRAGILLPLYWSRDGEDFAARSFAQTEPLDPDLPVCHVSWYEADAYARWAGKRLPTEAEWEKAASWDDATETKRDNPWGEEPADADLANLDQLTFGAAPCGAYEKGASPCGALQMAGDVWEWTASAFEGYPGFRAFPYEEYSQEFLGGPYRVLRGGAWATQPDAVSTTFRNWDYPLRRQLFAGFRCAMDAED